MPISLEAVRGLPRHSGSPWRPRSSIQMTVRRVQQPAAVNQVNPSASACEMQVVAGEHLGPGGAVQEVHQAILRMTR